MGLIPTRSEGGRAYRRRLHILKSSNKSREEEEKLASHVGIVTGRAPARETVAYDHGALYEKSMVRARQWKDTEEKDIVVIWNGVLSLRR